MDGLGDGRRRESGGGRRVFFFEEGVKILLKG